MKPFLIDVPVKINVWIRPECQRAQWETIRLARPSTLFVISDGGRNEKEWQAIRENRDFIESSIDWDCKVFKHYEEKNCGMYAMIQKYNEIVWSHVDECIFLEDDQIPAVSFFRFCAELLEKYRNDKRIACICGMNHKGVYEYPQEDYFFSSYMSIWGVATWKRVYEARDLSYAQDDYQKQLIKDELEHTNKMIIYDRMMNYPINPMYGNHIAGDEFWLQHYMCTQHACAIIPKRNMINCVGATNDAAHASDYRNMPKNIKALYYMKTYELDGPIVHPKFLLVDTEYTKDVLKQLHNSPIATFLRYLFSLNFQAIIASIRRKIDRRIEN